MLPAASPPVLNVFFIRPISRFGAFAADDLSRFPEAFNLIV
jgi:hypothetical protein